MADTPTIDLAKLQAEVANLSTDALKAQLLTIKVRQKKQQAKMQGSGAQKAYQAKQKALRKLLKERAIALGVYDAINEEAKAKADEELTLEAATSPDEEEVEA